MTDSVVKLRLSGNPPRKFKFTLVDSDALNYINVHRWYFHPQGYACGVSNGKNIKLHQFVWKLKHGIDSVKVIKNGHIDHINRNFQIYGS